ncbi:anhydro-N-acetylmuramic acid kinase [Candidatus Pelagibacter sp.]|nr:anhydro-N-acetylmuramic acid kinase [Candidatus Pelagibacter sp.]
MDKIFTTLGLMSGTSMDGVDASIIKSDGHSKFDNVLDKYWEFDATLHKKLIELRDEIVTKDKLIKFSNELKILERELTIFHSKIVNEIISNYTENIDLIGFHGQTIFHDPINRISKQLGDGELLSQLTKKKVVYNFRKNDLQNGGQGAPLTPIFHNLLANNIFNEFKDIFPNIINIGGISNITKTVMNKDELKNNIEAFDIGPGNCLIDEWMRKNSNKKFDKNGLTGESGVNNQLLFNQAIENFNFNSYKNSLDIKDFDISFVRGLSLEDGCATITNFTAYLIAEGIKFLHKKQNYFSNKYLICGGGRKNNFLIKTIKEYLNNFESISIENIDNFNQNGDFIESQAFGYLAIRSYLGLPITFPDTTGCVKPSTGGITIKNF